MWIHTWLVYLFLYAPIVILIIFSFNREKQVTKWRGFTFDWYIKLFRNEVIHAAVWNSLIVAAWTTLIATILGTLAGVGLARYRSRLKGPTQALLYLPIIIPEIVIGAALIMFFGVIQARLSLWTIVIAHIVFSVSYVAIIVRARLAGIDQTLEEAAADLGASPIAAFFRVTLPLLMPGIIAGALLVFTISIDDYVITSFVAGSNATTLPLQIYSMLKTGVTPEVNAVSTLLLLFTIVLIVAAQYLLRERSK